LDKSFTRDGGTFKIVGLKAGSRLRPVLCENRVGKQYAFPQCVVKDEMSKVQ